MNATDTVSVSARDSASLTRGAPSTGTADLASLPVSPAVYDFVDVILRGEGAEPADAAWMDSTDPRALPADPLGHRSLLVNLARINNLRRINHFFRATNRCLRDGGIYVCCMETLDQRWDRVFGKYPAPVAFLFYVLTFVLHRVLPKLSLTKQAYFRVTAGQNRLISAAEALGRLVCCGFEIVETRRIEARLFIVARKVRVTGPAIDPSYGPLFRAPRIGYRGKRIRVFKLRTMHPYSEYLQEYVFRNNALAAGGKFREDFRVTGWGRVCRRYWLDEVPMLINWLRGDLKLVGVRPLSEHYASLYPDELRLRRQQSKPGLIPPFYADLPASFEDILRSEERYLDSYERKPFRTDGRYFFAALYNILFRHARSA